MNKVQCPIVISIIIGVLLVLLGCQSLSKICYQYNAEVEKSIIDVIAELNASSFSIRDGKKLHKIFALIESCETETTIIFNFYNHMPKDVQKQIKSSNRYLMINERLIIPVIFYFDDGNSPIRKGGTNHGIIGGYLVKFNSYGEIIISGPVY